MRKFILPLLALGVSTSSMADAVDSFVFRNASTQPIIVFLDYNLPAAALDGIFVGSGFSGSTKIIKTELSGYNVSACWTSWSSYLSPTHTSKDCLDNPFVIVACKNTSPDRVTATGNPYGPISSNGPTLSCTSVTLINQ